ncbi:MAG: hypothetical protein Q8R00_04075 [Candidatus Nanoarchaeia archaeon]|nr:hypothetical protein [Candidatus Nanoarchaeia archaeon]
MATDNSYKEKKKIPWLKVIIFMSFLIILFWFIIFFWNRLGTIGTQAEIGVGEVTKTGIFEPIVAPFRNLNAWIRGTYGFTKPQVAEKQPSGIKIKNFKSGRTYFEAGQPVTLRADVQIDALPKDDASIRFTCHSPGTAFQEDIFGKIKMSRAEGDTIYLEKGKPTTTSIICEFEEGMPTVGGKPTTRKVTLSGEYINFATKSALKIYTLEDEALIEFGTKDPFEASGVDDPLLSSDRTIKPECKSGCGLTKLSLITSSQPLTRLGTYNLGIYLQKDQDWYGSVSSIQGIKLVEYPDTLTINKCDPEVTWEGQIGNGALLNQRLLAKEDIILNCEFQVTNPDQKLGDNVGQFGVEAVYYYEVESSTTVEIKPATNISNSSLNPATGSFIIEGELAKTLQ